MNSAGSESPISTLEAQETVAASGTYTVATIDYQPTNTTAGRMAPICKTENDSHPNNLTSDSSADQNTIKVFAPVMTHDVTLPNSARKYLWLWFLSQTVEQLWLYQYRL